MDDAGAVGAREPVRELRGDVEEPAQGHGPVLDDVAQRPPRDELHREERRAVGLPDVVDRDDVRVVQRGGGAGFVREAGEAVLVVREVRREDLERDLAAEAGVASAVNVPHAPRAEERHDLERAHHGSGCDGQRDKDKSARDIERKGAAVEAQAGVVGPYDTEVRHVRPACGSGCGGAEGNGG